MEGPANTLSESESWDSIQERNKVGDVFWTDLLSRIMVCIQIGRASGHSLYLLLLPGIGVVTFPKEWINTN